MEWRRCGYRSKICVLKSEFKEPTLKFHLDGVSVCLTSRYRSGATRHPSSNPRLGKRQDDIPCPKWTQHD